MERKIPAIEKHREGYIKIRVIESLQEIALAMKMLREGFSRNAAQKVFMAWKAMISALTAMNLDRLPRNEDERKWYYKSGYLVPTKSLKGISARLEELGYSGYGLSQRSTVALALHNYAYNDLLDGAGVYPSREDAVNDVIGLSRDMLALIKELFKAYWDDEIEAYYETAKKELEAVKF